MQPLNSCLTIESWGEDLLEMLGRPFVLMGEITTLGICCITLMNSLPSAYAQKKQEEKEPQIVCYHQEGPITLGAPDVKCSGYLDGNKVSFENIPGNWSSETHYGRLERLRIEQPDGTIFFFEDEYSAPLFKHSQKRKHQPASEKSLIDRMYGVCPSCTDKKAIEKEGDKRDTDLFLITKERIYQDALHKPMEKKGKS